MSKKRASSQRQVEKGGTLHFVSKHRSWLIPAFCTVIMVVITFVLYGYTQDLLTQRLRDRMIAIASTGASQFDAYDIVDINSVWSTDNLESPSLYRIVDKLNKIRDANANIQYTYLMRRTNDPDVFEFVADADTLLEPESGEDLNEDGVIDELEEIPMPGDPYEVYEYSVLRDEAFDHPAADRELQPDQWGLIMAAYAPIKDENDESVAILGIDVLVDDFVEKTRATFLPFILFVTFLVGLIALLTVLLTRIWRERVDAMQEIDRQKDELLSIVSHQLATPVSSVKWYLEMLLDGDYGKLTKQQGEQIQTMQSVAADLTDLVSMILDVSRIQLGRMKVDRSKLDLNGFFKEVLAVIKPKAEEKGVKFNINMPDKLPIAMLDKRLMRMTLENLLSNAVKYTPKKGEVTLNVEVNGNNMVYEVRDTGCGIPKADQGKMFTKLFRASNVQKTDGNGFGLFVAKGAVEAQGGTIEFESVEKKGTTFKVVVPLNVKTQS